MTQLAKITITIDSNELLCPPCPPPVEEPPVEPEEPPVIVQSARRSLDHRVVDFNFGCAMGVGFVAAVDGGLEAFTLSAPATKGSTSFAYTGLAPGALQLLVVLGTDGEYYTVVALSASSGTCQLSDALPCDVAAGQNAWSFWDNQAHPHEKGYAALADHALRQDMASWRKVHQSHPTVLTPGTLVAVLNNSVANPGSASSTNGWMATPGTGGGAQWAFTPPRGGRYRAVFECSKSAAGGSAVLTVESNGVVLKSYALGSTFPKRHEVDFYAPGPVTLKLTAGMIFTVSDMMILELMKDDLLDLNFGRQMVFGDSYVYDPVGPAARLAERLPDAEILKSGVGGNTSAQLIARFDADVAALGPFDIVWLVTTAANDIFGAVPAATYANNLAVLINKVQSIGAIPIIFTPYPGCTNIPTTIDLSRVYASTVPYYPV